MASRREFLQLGMAALALPISIHPPLSATPPMKPASDTSVELYKAVFDERFSESVAFAEELKALGKPVVHGIKGDITDLWFHELHARWKREPVAVAGLTGHGAVFCLERLAWDHRMRVVYRGEHQRLPDGRLQHLLSGPPRMLREAEDLSRSGADWPKLIARLVTRCPLSRLRATEVTIENAAAQPTDNPDPLISWVIAPRTA
jgi:hypothetical protein